jgi:hypothetical protein
MNSMPENLSGIEHKIEHRRLKTSSLSDEAS